MLNERAREAAVAEERNRLAREIHDTLAHYLTVVNVQLEAAEKLASEQPARSLDAVGRARRLTLQCLLEVRRSVGALRAATIEELTLPGALTRLVHEFSESTGIDVSLDLDGVGALQLTPEATQALYRTVQEALTNVQRHARASHAQVTLTAPSGLVSLRIEDDGVGPGAGLSEERGGFGLIGLRERVALLGGQLDFGPGPLTGACLTVTLPIEAGA
jgi:signal transduction histidine kinase